MKLVSAILFSATAILGTSCGGSSGDDDDDTPMGTRYKSVVDSATIPASAAEKARCSLDVDNDANGTVDNKLGDIIVTLGQMGFDVQTSLDASIDDGSILLLADVQTTDFTNASAAALRMYLGDMPNPAACTDPLDPTTCRQHLGGTGSFSIAAGSPTNSQVNGAFTAGVFRETSAGALSLQIALTDAAPINLDLLGARAKLTTVTATGIGEAVLAGAIAKSQVDNEIIPAIAGQLGDVVAGDCTNPVPPDCGCTVSSTGENLLDLFDANDDCEITAAELQSNAIISSALTPDVTIGDVAALSIGLCASTVNATYTAP